MHEGTAMKNIALPANRKRERSFTNQQKSCFLFLKEIVIAEIKIKNMQEEAKH